MYSILNSWNTYAKSSSSLILNAQFLIRENSFLTILFARFSYLFCQILSQTKNPSSLDQLSHKASLVHEMRYCRGPLLRVNMFLFQRNTEQFWDIGYLLCKLFCTVLYSSLLKVYLITCVLFNSPRKFTTACQAIRDILMHHVKIDQTKL